MSEYVPSILELQEAWISTYARDGQLTSEAVLRGQLEFKAGLKAHDRQVAAKAHRDGYRNALSDVESRALISGPPWSVREAIRAEAKAEAWEEGLNTGIGYKTAMDVLGPAAPEPENPYAASTPEQPEQEKP